MTQYAPLGLSEDTASKLDKLTKRLNGRSYVDVISLAVRLLDDITTEVDNGSYLEVHSRDGDLIGELVIKELNA